MNTHELASYLTKLKLLDNPDISLLGNGESNINYLATKGSTRYVVRMPREDVPKHSHFMAERHFMLFIEALGIEFAPRSIHYDTDKDVHIVSYIEGKDAAVTNLNNMQTKIFIEHIKRLNSITYEEYLAWCTQTGQSPIAPQTLALRDKVNIEDRLHVISEATSSSSFALRVVAWATPKIALLQAAEKRATLKTTFLHNDLRWTDWGGNLKISDGQLYFIDWELSGFFADAVPEVGDILGSIPYSATNLPILQRLYNDYIASEPDRSQIDKSIKYGVLWGKLGNPLWAAERYVILSSQNKPEVERYRRLAESGMKDAERFFGVPFEQWFV